MRVPDPLFAHAPRSLTAWADPCLSCEAMPTHRPAPADACASGPARGRERTPEMSDITMPSSSTLVGHQVRELVYAYRPARDAEGRVLRVPSLILSDPRAVARVSHALLAGQPVEVFAVACLSARHRLLAWHLVARGTRDGAAISIPDVFVPACVTPGTTGLVTVHNHPSGDPTPSPEDVTLTAKLRAAAALLDLALLDHLIVGDEGRYFSFREAGRLGEPPAGR